jgi:Trk-type K+ transport system membrane component
MNPNNDTWFNQFQIMFELVSAYSTVGLSLGIPTVSKYSKQRVVLTIFFQKENFSFSGAMKPLSKLILCAVMIRGRHRDLPVAIDRASKSNMVSLYEKKLNIADISFIAI